MISNGRRSLLLTLGLTLLGVQVLVTAVAAIWLWPMARRHVDSQAIEDAAHQVKQLGSTYSELVRHAEVEGDEAILQAAVRRDAALLDARITIFENEVPIIDSVERDDARLDQPWRRPEVAIAMQQGEAALVRPDVETGEPMLFAAARLTNSGDSSFTLRFGKSMVERNAWLNQLGGQLLLFALLLMATTTAGLALAARCVRQKAEVIARKMSELAEGNLRARFAPAEDAEFAPITRSLNHLTSRLSDHVDQLSQQKSMHQAILQSMGPAVIALDLDQQILDMNSAAERMLGCQAEESRGRLVHEVVRNAQLHRFIDESMRDATRPPIEFSLDPDGLTRIEVDSERLINAEGRPRGLVVILNDVTRLRRLESLRSDFAANVSHELRTPITNIKGYVETLIDVGLDDKDQAQRFLDVVNRNSNRLAAIIDDVMTLTKLEQPTARETLDRTPRSVTNIVRAVVGEFERLANAKKITLHTNVPDGLKVKVHAPLIEQAVGNLVSNAINYSPSNTIVTISARRAGSKVELEVADQGPGIAQQHLPRLFERFYRVDKARSREVGGTGLGLALVKHIALVHGGEVRVVSELGQGSVFTIAIPSE